MAYSIREQREGAAVRLRELLSEAERLSPGLTGANIETFLQILDEIEDLFEETEASGLDLRPEHSRRQSLHHRLDRKPGDVASAAAKVGGMATLRRRNPPAEHFWWHLDEEVARRRGHTIRRLLISVGSVILVLGGLYAAMRIFFPPDPDVLLVNSATNDLFDLTMEQDWEGALALIDASKPQLSRPDAELLIWEGVVADQLGQTARSQRALAEAQTLFEPELIADYWLTLSSVRLNVGDLDMAARAAEEALALDPERGQAYFLLGNVAEARGNVSEAVGFYDETFQRAIDANPQLAVLARVRAGTLMQQIELPSAVETATVEAP